MLKKTFHPEVITSETPFEVRCLEEIISPSSVSSPHPPTSSPVENTLLLCSVSGGERMGLLVQLTTAIYSMGLSIVQADIKTIPSKETILGSTMIAVNTFVIIDGVTQAKTFSPRRRREIELTISSQLKLWLEAELGMNLQRTNPSPSLASTTMMNMDRNKKRAPQSSLTAHASGSRITDGFESKVVVGYDKQYETLLKKGAKLTIEHNIVEERQLSLILRLMLTKLESLLSRHHAKECKVPLDRITQKPLVVSVRECRRNFRASDKEVPSWVLSSAQDLAFQLEEAIQYVAGMICLSVLRTWAARRKLFESVFAAICLQRNFRGARVRLHLNAAVVEGWVKGNIDIDIDDVVHAHRCKGSKTTPETRSGGDDAVVVTSLSSELEHERTKQEFKKEVHSKLRQEWI